MPVFPSFMRRFQETSPAATLFQGGITPRPYELQEDRPPARSSADGVRRRIAEQIRYEDIAPKLEDVPTTPPFIPKGKYGFVDRLKMALGGAGMGVQRGGGLGAIGGIIAGLINPEGVDRQGHATYRKPQYDAEVQAAMGRNKQKLEAFDSEMKAREIISKINQATAPKFRQATGSQYTLIFDENTGEFVPAMDQGEPVEAASVVVGRGHDTTQRLIEKMKLKGQEDRDRTQHGYKLEEIGAQGDIRKAITKIIQEAAMGRLRVSEGGRWGRQKRQLEAEYGYDTSGTGASTGSARPGGGAGNEETIKKLKERLKKSNQGLGPLDPDDDEYFRDNWWY